MRKHGLAPLWLVGIAGLIACGGGTDYSSSPSTDSSPASSCSPDPCLVTSGGMTVYVTGVEKNYLPDQVKDEPGKHLVRVMLRFAYSGKGTENAGNPLDVDLIGTDHVKASRDSVFTSIPGCTTPDTSDLAAGGQWGPGPFCFTAGGDTTGPLTLMYAQGFLASPISLTLP